MANTYNRHNLLLNNQMASFKDNMENLDIKQDLKAETQRKLKCALIYTCCISKTAIPLRARIEDVK